MPENFEESEFFYAIDSLTGGLGHVDHNGTLLSYIVKIEKENTLFFIFKKDQKETRIRIERDSSIDFIYPSVEGTTIMIYFCDESEMLYDVINEVEINKDYIKQVKNGERELPEIHFYN